MQPSGGSRPEPDGRQPSVGLEGNHQLVTDAARAGGRQDAHNGLLAVDRGSTHKPTGWTGRAHPAGPSSSCSLRSLPPR